MAVKTKWIHGSNISTDSLDTGTIIFDSSDKKIKVKTDSEVEIYGDGPSNIKDATVTGGINQIFDGEDTLDVTGKNPNATALDATITGSLTRGATGQYASSFGGKSIASGKRSFAEGTTTIAKGNYSHAEGDNSVALGSDSHAEGYQTVTGPSAMSAHAEGNNTQAVGKASHSEGSATTASGDSSHAEGIGTNAPGISSHAEGESTTARGDYSHSEGSNTTASGNYSHAEGESTTASGNTSHSEGSSSRATGDYSHSEGYNTMASGEASHAEGNTPVASGNYSHAEGFDTQAIGLASHSEGEYTIAGNEASHAQGVYNEDVANAVDMVGIGTADDERKNAELTLFDGKKYVINVGGFDGTSESIEHGAKSLQESVNEVASDLLAEMNNRESADSALDSRIDTSAQQLQGAISAVEGKVTEEASAREQADTDLQSAVDNSVKLTGQDAQTIEGITTLASLEVTGTTDLTGEVTAQKIKVNDTLDVKDFFLRASDAWGYTFDVFDEQITIIDSTTGDRYFVVLDTTLGKAIDIYSEANLDNYKSPYVRWYTHKAGRAISGTLPDGVTASDRFRLKVLPLGDSYVEQRLTVPTNGSIAVYTRVYDGSSWGTWESKDSERKVVETTESDITLAANTITRLTGTTLTSLSVSVPTEAFTDGQEYILEYSKSCLSVSCTVSFDSTIKWANGAYVPSYSVMKDGSTIQVCIVDGCATWAQYYTVS